MIDTEFANIIQKISTDKGKGLFIEPKKLKSLLLDYTKNEYKRETALLSAILETDSVKYINRAENLAECKRYLVKQLDDNHSLSPAKSAEMLDLLFLTLRGVELQSAIVENTGSVNAENQPQPGQPLANFVRVEGGTFRMGSADGRDEEQPLHTVTVKSFSIGKYAVTQKEWQEVIGNNPSFFKGDNLPVENVGWYKAVDYCNKRSLKEGLTSAYRGSGDSITCDWNADGYRLPTEAEWEYAAKGGNGSPGNYTYSGSDNIDIVAWYYKNSGTITHPVGIKAANGLGIHDMSGNVLEWCWDWYGDYSSEARTDPVGPVSGADRVQRGGSWFDTEWSARSSNRVHLNPSYVYNTFGFRLVRPSLE
jgi:formylglycine-generating enzyme required for sulfatase activity